jgi:hypothetical protein
MWKREKNFGQKASAEVNLFMPHRGNHFLQGDREL